MDKKEKVVKGLECCINNERATPDCMRCPYAEINGICIGLHKLHGDAIALLKAQDALISMSRMVGKAHWIPCKGRSHIWYCSNCGEKINYNDARRTYQKEKKPVECVNRHCRGCGFEMLPSPTVERQLTDYSPTGTTEGVQ